MLCAKSNPEFSLEMRNTWLSPYDAALRHLLIGGGLHGGHPRTTWLRTIDDDLQSLNFGVHTA